MEADAGTLWTCWILLSNLCGGDVADVLGRQVFEKGGLPAVVQTQQQNPNLLVWRAL